MIQVPAVFAYVAASILTAVLLIGGTATAAEILLCWDRSSGSERQIKRERRTYLISTIMTCIMVYELLSLFFFIAISDHLHIFFTGAMCAAGTLFANPYGHITLVLKILSFLACGFWLTLNHLDNQSEEYPLLRIKYILLLPISALILSEIGTGLRFFAGLDSQIITSCCAVLFDSNRSAVELINFPVIVIRTIFFIVLAGVLSSGLYFAGTGKGAKWFGLMNLLLLPVALAAVISFFCLYFYELPTHHCPFCLLQKEYYYVGYFLYFSVFVGTIMGTMAGTIGTFKQYWSMKHVVPRFQKQLCINALAAHSIFALLACYPMFFSEFRL